MNKILMILTMLLVSSVTLAATNVFPELPTDCFEDENYCYDVGVVHSQEIGRRVIRVDFHAQLDADNFESYQEIIDLFLGFDFWQDILPSIENYSSVKSALKYEDVVFIDSHELPQEMINGQMATVHHSHCWTSAPWPLSRVEMIEKVYYVDGAPLDGSLYALRFFPDKSYPASKGLKHKTGKLNIRYDEEEDTFILFVTVDIVAEIDFLPTIAAPYVGKGLVAIFEGIFSEYL